MSGLELPRDFDTLAEWVERQPDTDEGAAMRALVAEVRRLRARVEDVEYERDCAISDGSDAASLGDS